jgi:hypothetical protein
MNRKAEEERKRKEAEQRSIAELLEKENKIKREIVDLSDDLISNLLDVILSSSGEITEEHKLKIKVYKSVLSERENARKEIARKKKAEENRAKRKIEIEKRRAARQAKLKERLSKAQQRVERLNKARFEQIQRQIAQQQQARQKNPFSTGSYTTGYKSAYSAFDYSDFLKRNDNAMNLDVCFKKTTKEVSKQLEKLGYSINKNKY